jgi:uncharacterized protein YciI
MNWYLAIRRMAEPRASWHDLLPDHFAWLKDNHDTGTIIMSGPGSMSGPDSISRPGAEPSLGIYVMRALSVAEATRIVQADPLLQSPGATVEVIEWQVHQIMGVGAFDAGTR